MPARLVKFVLSRKMMGVGVVAWPQHTEWASARALD
jgi:hypothetical protein